MHASFDWRAPAHLVSEIDNMFLDLEALRLHMGADASHRLDLVDTRTTRDSRQWRESYLYKELDSQGRLIHHYRIWCHQGLIAPYRIQQGWEKYDPKGRLLDREIRYSRRSAPPCLH